MCRGTWDRAPASVLCGSWPCLLLVVPSPACCPSVQLCPLCLVKGGHLLLQALPLEVTSVLGTKGLCRGQEKVPGGHLGSLSSRASLTLGSGSGKALRESGQAIQEGVICHWTQVGLSLFGSSPQPRSVAGTGHWEQAAWCGCGHLPLCPQVGGSSAHLA